MVGMVGTREGESCSMLKYNNALKLINFLLLGNNHLENILITKTE